MPYAVNEGTRIHYDITGAGPVVVLMHGVGDTSEIWRQLGAVELLAANFTVVTIDSRGLGDSDRPRRPSDYTRDLRREDTVAGLDEIGAERAHLVGYSLGARNAFYVATDYPERVASVVAVAANPHPTPINLKLTRHLWSPKRPPRPIRALRRLRRTVERRLRGQSVDVLVSQADSGDFDVDAAVAAMTMPVLLVTGEFDERFAVELTKEFAGRLPNSELEIVSGEDHGMLPRLQPTLPTIEAFLLRVSAAPA